MVDLRLVLPIAQLARIAQIARASSAGELAQENGKVAELAPASSALWNMKAQLAQLPISATLILSVNQY